MNKAELSAQVAKKNDIKKQDALALVDSVFETIEEALIANERVTIIGFGAFEPVVSKERMGRNPRNGTTVKIASKRKVRWGASAILKKKLNNKVNK